MKRISRKQSRRNTSRRQRRVATRHAGAGHWSPQSKPMMSGGRVHYEIGAQPDVMCFGGIGAIHIAVLALDGAMVPTRPESAKQTRPGRRRQRAHRARWKGEYREAKGFRLFLVDEDRVVHLISWHQVADDKQIGEALKRLKDEGRIPEDQVRLCVIGDGASWIWKWAKELFPSARQVLDYYHLSQYLNAVDETKYASSPSRACEWLEASMARLNCHEAAGVLWGLQRMPPASDEAAKAIQAAVSYLTEHLSRLDYGSHRKGGYPIGSGAIESAHRFVAHARLKRSGAWWYEESSNHMLALRCAKYNGTLDAVFELATHDQ